MGQSVVLTRRGWGSSPHRGPDQNEPMSECVNTWDDESVFLPPLFRSLLKKNNNKLKFKTEEKFPTQDYAC